MSIAPFRVPIQSATQPQRRQMTSELRDCPEKIDGVTAPLFCLPSLKRQSQADRDNSQPFQVCPECRRYALRELKHCAHPVDNPSLTVHAHTHTYKTHTQTHTQTHHVLFLSCSGSLPSLCHTVRTKDEDTLVHMVHRLQLRRHQPKRHKLPNHSHHRRYMVSLKDRTVEGEEGGLDQLC
jgi:hypothetical protein